MKTQGVISVLSSDSCTLHKNICEQARDQTTTPKASKLTELSTHKPTVHLRDLTFYNTNNANKLPTSTSVLNSKIDCSFLWTPLFQMSPKIGTKAIC